MSVLLGAATAALLVGYTGWAWRRHRWVRSLGRRLRRVVGAPGPGEALLLGVVSGTAEELLFRGWLQPHVGLLPASLLFAALHVWPPLRLHWPWPLFALAAGLAFGAIYEATRNLAGPALGHSLVNAVNLGRLRGL